VVIKIQMNQNQLAPRKDEKKKDGAQKQVTKKSPEKNMSEIDEHILKSRRQKDQRGCGD
jgi:hypothetical protein